MGSVNQGMRVASRYARAIFSYVNEDKVRLESLLNDLESFWSVFEKNRSLVVALTNPAFPITSRVLVVEDLTKRMGLQDDASRVLRVLAEKERLVFVEQIIRAVDNLRLKKLNLVALTVESASELALEQKKMIVNRFGVLFGCPVEASFRVVPGLIGGFRATANGKTYDGSVASWLNVFQQYAGG